jgi:serine/threonine protein kinase
MYPHFPRLVSRTPNPVLLMTDILEALALLADSNIVHRDVKPENVMLSSS